MSVRIDTGQWMISVPGTPFGLAQHFIPPKAATRPYASSYAYVAPCTSAALCIPATPQYRNGIPLCPACAKFAKAML